MNKSFDILDIRIRILIQGLVCFLLLLAFTATWVKNEFYYFNGFQSIEFLFSQISFKDETSRYFVLGLAHLVTLILFFWLSTLTSLKTYLYFKNWKNDFTKLDRYFKWNFTLLFPSSLLILLVPLSNEYWGYKVFIGLVAIISFFQVSSLDDKEELKSILEFKRHNPMYKGYSAAISPYFKGCMPVNIYMVLILCLFPALITKTHLGTGSIFIMGLLGLVLSLFLAILDKPKLKDNDLFQFIAIGLATIGAILTSLPTIGGYCLNSLTRFTVFSLFTFIIYFSFLYLKDLKIRFYSCWIFTLLFVLFNLVVY